MMDKTAQQAFLPLNTSAIFLWIVSADQNVTASVNLMLECTVSSVSIS